MIINSDVLILGAFVGMAMGVIICSIGDIVTPDDMV